MCAVWLNEQYVCRSESNVTCSTLNCTEKTQQRIWQCFRMCKCIRFFFSSSKVIVSFDHFLLQVCLVQACSLLLSHNTDCAHSFIQRGGRKKACQLVVLLATLKVSNSLLIVDCERINVLHFNLIDFYLCVCLFVTFGGVWYCHLIVYFNCH